VRKNGGGARAGFASGRRLSPCVAGGGAFSQRPHRTKQHRNKSVSAMAQIINNTGRERASSSSPFASAASVGSRQSERGVIRLNAKFPAHNNYFCSYEVFIESEIFKPEAGRTAMLYFDGSDKLERAFFEFGRFCFFLPKSVQPVFEEALTNKNLVLTVQIVTDANHPARDQTEAVFRLSGRDLK
jgi:hypothetical protein